jgi:hypothetical protein
MRLKDTVKDIVKCIVYNIAASLIFPIMLAIIPVAYLVGWIMRKYRKHKNIFPARSSRVKVFARSNLDLNVKNI